MELTLTPAKYPGTREYLFAPSSLVKSFAALCRIESRHRFCRGRGLHNGDSSITWPADFVQYYNLFHLFFSGVLPENTSWHLYGADRSHAAAAQSFRHGSGWQETFYPLIVSTNCHFQSTKNYNLATACSVHKKIIQWFFFKIYLSCYLHNVGMSMLLTIPL